MTHQLLSISVVAIAACAGCASQTEARPEPQTPQLTIADQSTDAPPPPPPSAPPPGAQSSAPPPPPAEQSPPSSAPPSPSQPPSAPPAPLNATGAPPPALQAQPAPPPSAPEAPPTSAQWAYEYPTGRWVYANGYGWMWVPANADVSNADGVPYTYLYTPTYGWNWYVSPWGPGAYRYGVWVRHPYYPVGYRGGWVARPRVVVRLGGPGHGYYHHRHGW